MSLSPEQKLSIRRVTDEYDRQIDNARTTYIETRKKQLGVADNEWRYVKHDIHREADSKVSAIRAERDAIIAAVEKGSPLPVNTPAPAQLKPPAPAAPTTSNCPHSKAELAAMADQLRVIGEQRDREREKAAAVDILLRVGAEMDRKKKTNADMTVAAERRARRNGHETAAAGKTTQAKPAAGNPRFNVSNMTPVQVQCAASMIRRAQRKGTALACSETQAAAILEADQRAAA